MFKLISANRLNRFWQNGILPIKNQLSNKITSGADLMSNTESDYIPDAIAVKEAINLNVVPVEIDTTLSIEGQAADAKATGDGLGKKFDASKRIADYDDLMANSVSGYMADAVAVKEGFNNVNSSLGGLSFGKDGDGNYGYYGADGSLIPFSSGSGAFKLLYTRPTETRLGAVTLLTEDMTQYDGVLVIVGGRYDYDHYLISDSGYCYKYCPVGSTVTLKYVSSSSNITRTLTVTETGVSCGTCSTGQGYCLPNEIYGVKFTE